MLKKIIAICALSMILLCYIDIVYAMDEIPGRTKVLVNDYAGVIDDKTKVELEKELGTLKRDKDVELIVSTFASLNGKDFETFVTKYTHKWRRLPLLENDKRMHIIIAVREGKARIGTGRGVDEIITPEVVDEVLSKDMLPEFSKGRYGAGIKAGTDAIIRTFNESKMPLRKLPFNPENVVIFLFTIAAIAFILFYRDIHKGPM